MTECIDHPQLRARATIVDDYGVDQPAPAPRFSRTPGAIQGPPPWPGQHTDAALADWGFSGDELAKLHETGAIK
jgi:alpha-methylacyl-CoA racemase